MSNLTTTNICELNSGTVDAPVSTLDDVLRIMKSLRELNSEMYAMLEEVIIRGVSLLNSDEVEDSEDLASIHANFNDTILNVEKLLSKVRSES